MKTASTLQVGQNTFMKAASSLRERLGRPLSAGLVVALILSFLLNIAAVSYQLRAVTRGPPSYTYIGDDHPRELPLKVRTVNMNFHDDPEHYAMTGQLAWAEWNAIRPPGKGFVFLGESYFAFGVSLWHQLHCLNHIRAALVHGDDGSDHTEHCFHYLRQGILCAADTTLEPGGTGMLVEDGDKVATGVNVTHTCRDWKQVHDWMADAHEKWTPEQKVRINMPSGHAGHAEMAGHDHHM